MSLSWIADVPRSLRGGSPGWQARHGGPHEHLTAVTAIAAAVVVLILMALPAVMGNVYTRDDLGAYHLPLRYFYAQQLAAGESFDWHPGLFGGFYLTGEGQLGSYHPWHLLLYRFLPLPAAFAAELLSSYGILWGGTFVLIRRMTRDRAAAAWAALIFAFGGFSFLRFVHPNAVAVVAHLPWLLWIEDQLLADAARLSQTDRPRRTTARPRSGGQRLLRLWLGYGVLTGSQWLLGYPQYVWYSSLAEIAWFMAWFIAWCPACTRHREWFRRPSMGRFLAVSVFLLASAKCWGLALGAVQFLPTWEMLRDSARAAATPEFLASGSLHPANLLQLVAPYLLRDRVVGGNTHEMGLYLGAGPFCLALAGWAIPPKRRRDRILPAASAMGAILAILAAVGRYAPLFALQQMLPFRCPSRAIVLFQFCAVIAAAYGLQSLLRLSQRSAKPDRVQRAAFCRTICAIAAASACAAVFRIFLPRWIALPWSEVAGALAGAVLFSLAALAIAAAAHGYRLALVGLILLTAGDLAAYGLSYAVWRQIQPFEAWRSRAAVPPLSVPDADSLPSRVVFLPDAAGSSPTAVGNEGLVQGLRRMDGYAGLPPRRVLDMNSLAARRLASVGWVGRWKSFAPGRLTVVWERSPHPLPRFRTVGRVVVASPTPAVIEAAVSGHAAVVEKPVRVSPHATARLSILDDRPGRAVVGVQASGPVLLVVSEAYHSGWRAAVDDRETEVLRVNGDFMGCVVPPGRHRVSLAFRPWSLTLGRRISLAALTLSAGVFLFSLHPPGGRGRKQKSLN